MEDELFGTDDEILVTGEPDVMEDELFGIDVILDLEIDELVLLDTDGVE